MRAQRKTHKISLEQALELAEKIEQNFLHAGFKKIELVGSARRKDPEIGDLDFVVYGNMENVKHISDEIVEIGEEKATIIYDGFQVNIWYSPLESWGAAIFHYIGPRGYIIGYKKKAKEQGWKLTEKGLFDKTGKMIAGKTEDSIYKAFGKSWKKPNERGI